MTRKSRKTRKNRKTTNSSPQLKRLSISQIELAEIATNRSLTALGLILVIFGFICGAATIHFNSGEQSKYSQMTSKGGLFGPFTVIEDNSSYEINLFQSHLKIGNWNAITIEVLDSNKRFVYGYGDELWRETGIDEGQRWDETKNAISMKMFFSQKGQYYLNITPESNFKLNSKTHYYIQIIKLNGSAVIFNVLMWFGLITGSIVLIYRYREELGENN